MQTLETSYQPPRAAAYAPSADTAHLLFGESTGRALRNPLKACAHVAGRSRLMKLRGRHAVIDHETHLAVHGRPAALARMLPEFVFGSNHPCVMARSVLQQGAIRAGIHSEFEGAAAAVTCHDLYECLAEMRSHDGAFVSYAALFPASGVADERDFERSLWRYLQAMHEVDRDYFPWDPTVSSDPRDADFSFSIGGRAWYVVGMHPKASRLARRFPVPAVVFNPHAQFERLRVTGKYTALRDRIRQRDFALQGSVNPMLKDHGSASEAKQYSGRAASDSWQCPFAHGQSRGA